MMITKLPGYTFKDLGPDGGPYDQSNNPKVLVHTTQGSTIEGAESAFRNYPPHLGYDPVRRIKRQYVSLDRHSYAIRNAEAEDDFVIQVEVVGFAESTHKWPDQYYRNFAEDVIMPLEKAIKVPRRYRRFYRAGENGYVLASKNSPIRMTNAEWRAFSGWLGHQHAPAPDEHWDPGGFLMDKAFSFVPGKEAELMSLIDMLNTRVGTNGSNEMQGWADKPGTFGHFLLNQAMDNDAARVYTDEVEPMLRKVDQKLDAVLSKLNASGGPISGS